MSRRLYMPGSTLSDIVEDWVWCKQVTSKEFGSKTISPKGFIFISLLYAQPLRGIRYKKGVTWFLYVKPTVQAWEKARIGCVSGRLNALELIQQVNDPDTFLVTSSDSSTIGNPWLTYISRDQLPSVEFIENVPEYTGV